MENLLWGIVGSLGIFVGGVLLYLLIKSIVLKPKPTTITEVVMGKVGSVRILPVNYQYQESAVSYINPISIGLSQIFIGLMGDYVKQYQVVGTYIYKGKTFSFEIYITHQNINFNNVFKKFNTGMYG